MPPKPKKHFPVFNSFSTSKDSHNNDANTQTNTAINFQDQKPKSASLSATEAFGSYTNPLAPKKQLSFKTNSKHLEQTKKNEQKDHNELNKTAEQKLIKALKDPFKELEKSNNPKQHNGQHTSLLLESPSKSLTENFVPTINLKFDSTKSFSSFANQKQNKNQNQNNHFKTNSSLLPPYSKIQNRQFNNFQNFQNQQNLQNLQKLQNIKNFQNFQNFQFSKNLQNSTTSYLVNNPISPINSSVRAINPIKPLNHINSTNSTNPLVPSKFQNATNFANFNISKPDFYSNNGGQKFKSNINVSSYKNQSDFDILAQKSKNQQNNKYIEKVNNIKTHNGYVNSTKLSKLTDAQKIEKLNKKLSNLKLAKTKFDSSKNSFKNGSNNSFENVLLEEQIEKAAEIVAKEVRMEKASLQGKVAVMNKVLRQIRMANNSMERSPLGLCPAYACFNYVEAVVVPCGHTYCGECAGKIFDYCFMCMAKMRKVLKLNFS